MTFARRLAVRVYAILLRAFPPAHRHRYGPEMLDAFARELNASARGRAVPRALWFTLAAYADVVRSGLEERRRVGAVGTAVPARSGRGSMDAFFRDVLHAVRSLSKAKTYTLVCVLSLAIGIGANVGVVVFLQAIWSPPARVEASGLVELVVRPLGPARADILHARVRVAQVGEVGIGPQVGWPAVAPDYFRTMGVTPILGRGFVPSDRDRSAAWVNVLARMPEGMSVDQANAALSTVMARLERTYPEANEDKGAEAVPYSGVPALMRAEMTFVLGIFYSAAGVVLLVVCLNIAGMVLVRSASRERELAVRLAIGSSRGRLVRYMMSEALVLAVASGIVAMVGIFGSVQLLAWRLSQPVPDGLRPDLGILAVCTGLALVTTLAVGLWPALRFSRPPLYSALRDDAGGGGRRTGRLHRIAAAIQAGLALPFLVVGAIYLDHARTGLADLGFEPAGLFASRLSLAPAGYTHQQAEGFLRGVEERLQRANGVSVVAFGSGLPLDFVRRRSRVARLDDPDRLPVRTTRVSEGYLAAIGTPVLRGRDIGMEDRPGTEPVVVITESLSAQLWPGENPLGQHLTFAIDGTSEERFTVVGVAADVAGAQAASERAAIFVPLAQHPAERVFVVVRAAADPEAMAATLRETIEELDPDLVRPEVVTGADLLDHSYWDFVTASVVSGLFAAIALVLAALGVYGIVAFMVASRTRELGVRMAMGASRRRLIGEVFRDGARLALPGLLGGTLLTSVFLRIKTDIPTATPLVYAAAFAVAIAIALGIVLLASLGPALRAAGVQPAEAMRPE